MSAMSTAPTSREISAKAAKSIILGYSTGPGDNHPGLVFARKVTDLVIVDPMIVVPYRVWNHVINLARKVLRMPHGQMASMGKVHPQVSIPGFHNRKEDSHISLGAGMRLDVDMIAPEQVHGTFSSQFLHDIRVNATSIISSTGVTFSVLFVRMLPCASMTAREVKFSEAINSRRCSCRLFSLAMILNISGSVCSNGVIVFLRDVEGVNKGGASV